MGASRPRSAVAHIRRCSSGRSQAARFFFVRGPGPTWLSSRAIFSSRWARRKIAEGPGCLLAQLRCHERQEPKSLGLPSPQRLSAALGTTVPVRSLLRLYNHPSMKKVVHAACPHDCPDACGVLITVEDGKATRIQGDPAHPVTRGFLCAKVAKYLDRVYSPDRVLYPMKRVRPKGPSRAGRPRHTRLSSASPGTKALDEITSQLPHHNFRVRYRVDPALLLRRHAGSAQRFFDGPAILPSPGRFPTGPHHLFGGGEAGLKSVLGIKTGTEPEQFAHRATSSPGAPTFSATTFTCGPSSWRPAATARSW